MSSTQKLGNAVELFYVYTHKDERWRKRLEIHLSNLRRQGIITEWHDRKISAGTIWTDELDSHINSAHIILLLISPDFIASDYCYSIEMQRAVERYKDGEAYVIPIILRPTDWKGSPIEQFQALPTDARPVTRWRDHDEALLNIANGIRKAIDGFSSYSFSIPSSPTDNTSVKLNKHSLEFEKEKAVEFRQENNNLQGEHIDAQISKDREQQHKEVKSEAILPHGDDLRTSTTMAKQIGVNTRYIHTGQSARADYYAHESLPTRYVSREEVMMQVRNILLSKKDFSIALLSDSAYTGVKALHGMGGIGKTVIARKLCDDPYVHNAFPDGILWATLGQTPDTKSFLRDWIRKLGREVHEQTPTVNFLKNELADLLKDRSCLLVLDDVWKQAHAEDFRVGGPQCHLLMTTRDAEIARALGARVHYVAPMAEKEALELLEKWAEGKLQTTPLQVKIQVVKRLGYVPLAVALAGAQLRDQEAGDWLKDFDILELRSNRPTGHHHDSFVKTIELSLRDLDAAYQQQCPLQARTLYVALMIFKDDERIPQRAIERLWGELGGIDARTTNYLLADLQARALLERDLSDRTIRIHDLLREVMNAEIGGRGHLMHKVLLNAYRKTGTSSGWYTCPNDGYLYEHLAYHLEQSGQQEELKNLFAHQDWLHARVSQQEFMYDGYLRDLNLVWQCAEQEARQQLLENRVPIAIGDCVRYLFIWSSINSLAGQYVPELVGQAVKRGLWSPLQALSAVVKSPDRKQKVKICLEALQVEWLENEIREMFLKLGLETALKLNFWDSSEKDLLVGLASHLPIRRGKEILQQALEASLALEDKWSWNNDKYDRIKLLATLVSQLQEAPKQEVLRLTLEAAFAEKDGWRKADLLTLLVPHLPTEQRGEVMQQALEAALALTDGWPKPNLLIALVPHLPTAQRRKVLQNALATILAQEDKWSWSGSDKVKQLVTLAPQLPEKSRQKALQHALETAFVEKNEWQKVDQLALLAPHLLTEQREEVLQLALETTLALESSGFDKRQRKKDLLTTLAPHLSDDLYQRALETILAQEDKRDKEDLLVALIPHLSDDLYQWALETISSLKERAELLVVLTPHLPEDLCWQAVKAAFALENSHYKVELLSILASRLPAEQGKEVLQQALKTVFTLKDEWQKAKLLSILAFQFPDEQREEVLQHALEVSLALSEEWSWSWRNKVELLITLAPHFPTRQRRKALQQALDIILSPDRSKMWWSDDREKLLAALAPLLPNDMCRQALNATRVLLDDKDRGNEDRAELISVLASQLLEGQREEVLQQALGAISILVLEGKAKLLNNLIPHLPVGQKREVLQQALEATLDLDYGWGRHDLLAALAPYLPKDLCQKALKEIRFSLHGDETRVELLVALLPHLPTQQRGKVLQQALKTTLVLENKWLKAYLLAILVPSLPIEQSGDILRKAIEISFEKKDAELLINLLSHLLVEQKGEVLQKALEATFAEKEVWRQAELLTALVPHLSDDLCWQVVKKMFILEDDEDEEDGIELIIDEDTVELLSILAPRLPTERREEILQQALAATFTVEDKERRLQSMMYLLQCVSNREALLKDIQFLFIEILQIFKHASRREVFRFYNQREKLWTSGIFPPDILSAIVASITEISGEWQWL